MEPRKAIRDVQESDAAARPRLVLVQHHIIVQNFPPEAAAQAHRLAETIALTTGNPVSIYEVDARLPVPPAVGSAIDPEAEGWVEVEREQA